MLIIFDLDDTLIDTSGSILPGVLNNALKSIERSGFFLENFQKAYDELLLLNTFHFSAKSALMEFLEINQAPEECLQIGMHEIYENPQFNQPIYPLENAIEVLKDLSQEHQLILVTKGKEEIQREKMKKAGISTKFFTRLYFCEKGNKKKLIKKLPLKQEFLH